MITVDQLLERGKKAKEIIDLIGSIETAMLIRTTLNPRQEGLVLERLRRHPLMASLAEPRAWSREDRLVGVYGGFVSSALESPQTIAKALQGDEEALRRMGSLFEKPRASPDDVSSYLSFVMPEIAYLDDEVTRGLWESWHKEGYFTIKSRVIEGLEKNPEETVRAISRGFWAALREQDYARMSIGLSRNPEIAVAFARKYASRFNIQLRTEETDLRQSAERLKSESAELRKQLAAVRESYASLEVKYADSQRAQAASQPKPAVQTANGAKDDKSAARIASLEHRLQDSEDALEKTRGDYRLSVESRERIERELDQARTAVETATRQVRVMDTLIGLRGKKVAFIGGDNWARDKVVGMLGRYGIEISHFHQADNPTRIRSMLAGADYVILNSAYVSHDASNALRREGIKFYTGPRSLETIDEFVATLADPSLARK